MAFFTSAILLATFSLLVMLLVAPALYWHLQHRNTGASFAIAWVLVMNLIIFTNALIWPNDDLSDAFQGQIVCDIQVKIQIASQVGLPASFACIVRALAMVMDVDRVVLSSTKAEKRRELAINLVCCLGFPCLQMVFHYVIQARRYFIAGVCGCLPSANNSWLTVVLIYVPPVLWDLVCSYYTVIIIIRLQRYRRSFRTILAARRTNRSRFLRLYLICLLWLIASVPIQAYIFYINLSYPRDSYSWDDSHDPTLIGSITLIPTNGVVFFDRFVWLSTGFAIFLFFGIGRDAVKTYSTWLVALRLHWLLPETLRQRLMLRQQGNSLGESHGTRREQLLDPGSIVSNVTHDVRFELTDTQSGARCIANPHGLDLGIADSPATKYQHE